MTIEYLESKYEWKKVIWINLAQPLAYKSPQAKLNKKQKANEKQRKTSKIPKEDNQGRKKRRNENVNDRNLKVKCRALDWAKGYIISPQLQP